MQRSASADANPGKRSCGLTVVGVIWTVFSSVFLICGLWMIGKSVAGGFWDTVPCVIERFEILADPGHEEAFRPDLVYRYEVDGVSHTGTRLWTEKEASNDYEDLSQIREELAQGPEGPLTSLTGVVAECRVDPANPEKSSLAGGDGGLWIGGILFAGMGGLFVLIGLGLTMGGVSDRSEPKSRAKDSRNASPAIAAVFFLIFGCAGLAILIGFVLPKAKEWIEMKRWQETPAEIIWSRVTEHQGDDSTTYKVDLFYRYELAGREYRSNRYSLAGGSSSGRSEKEAIVTAHPPGTALMVHVDPDRPWRAVVKREAGWAGFLVLFPLPFIAIGFGGLWGTIRKSRAGPPTTGVSGGNSTPRPPKVIGQEPPMVSGAWESSGGKKGCGLVFLICFTLFWNGFNALLLTQPSGDVMTLFMIPFVLIGIGLIAMTIYTGISLFGPVFELQIANSDLPPGSSTQVRWRRAGGRGEIREFTLMLIGREEATYSAGSSTSTAKSIFHEQILFQTTVSLATRNGHTELRIPPEAVPTFQGEHNRLRWFLCLRCDVPGMPDIRDEREIIIRRFTRAEIP